MLVYAALVAVLVLGFRLLPTAFLPQEDQGYFMASYQLPADALARVNPMSNGALPPVQMAAAPMPPAQPVPVPGPGP